MADPTEKLLPRFRYGVIHPRANEEFQRGPAYQLYRLVPLDVMEISTGLGLENYTPEGVERPLPTTGTALRSWQKKRRTSLFSVARRFRECWAGPGLSSCSARRKKNRHPGGRSLEALIAAMNHLGLKTLTIGSRWADAVNEAMTRYLEAGGIKVVGITKRNQWAADAFAMSLEEGLKIALEVGREAAKLAPGRMLSPCPGSSDGSPRHPGFGRGIRQAGIYKYERGGLE